MIMPLPSRKDSAPSPHLLAPRWLAGQKRRMHRLILALALFLTAPLMAELPPSAYEAMQAKAPEFLEVEVLSVGVKPSEAPNEKKITLTARVGKTFRSASGVGEGAIISITYSEVARPTGWVGPGRVPILKEGDKKVAYLEKGPKPNQYLPAAGAMTFQQF
jgi:hypothetical protein